MIKHKWIGLLSALLMAASMAFLSVGYVAPSVFEAITGSSEPRYVYAMDKTKVLDMQIIADEQEWADMLATATDEEYIPATVIIDGVKIENVGIRPKGNSSLSMVAQDDTTDRYSFKIEFDRYVAGQTWLGLDKIVVNNMQGDATYMKEYLSYDLMEYVGVETPLYTFSSISVNGESWGFYLAVEALEDSYAKRVYGNDHGKLYKPESMGMRGNGQMNDFLQEMQDETLPQQENAAAGEKGQAQFPAQGQGQMPAGNAPAPDGGRNGFGGGSGGATLQYTDDEIASYSVIFENAVFDSTDRDYRRVIQALQKLDAGEDLAHAVDVEATLKYFAAHTVIVNLDSYVSNMCHNYYLYEKDGQLTMLPWDFNLAFGGFQSGSASAIVNFPIDTPVSGINLEDRPILAKLLEVPEYLELYHSYLQQIVDGYFNSGLFSQTIDALDSLISSYVANDPTAFYELSAYQSGVEELKKLGLLRAESIKGQLDGSIPSTTAGQSAKPDMLVDSSSINLSALGSMGGGRGGFGGIPGAEQTENRGDVVPPDAAMQGFDRANMQKAMEIIQAAGESELTEEQLAQLQDLGFTQEQIAMLKSRGQGRPGGGRPGNRPGEGTQNDGSASLIASSGFDTNTWILLGSSALLLLGGLLFVLLYKRRRAV